MISTVGVAEHALNLPAAANGSLPFIAVELQPSFAGIIVFPFQQGCHKNGGNRFSPVGIITGRGYTRPGSRVLPVPFFKQCAYYVNYHH